MLTTSIGTALAGGSRVADRPVLSLHQPRIVVLKSQHLMHLLDGERLVRTYGVDLGVNPVGPKRRTGDGRTPEGRFRIVSKNAASPYHRFLGIDYPDVPAAAFGLRHGLISPGDAISIVDSIRAGRCPDWGTALGGGVGIHGSRMGRDWTAGCVAISDSEIEELFSVLRIGDPLEILP